MKITEIKDIIHTLWSKYGFEIVVGICILFIILTGIINNIFGRKGTYSSKKTIFETNRSISRYKGISKPEISPKGIIKESRGEAECRKVLQQLFQKPFTSQRPDFLRNPVTGGNFNLELDCYNSSMGLAVEYNGIQHYKYSPYFHRNKDQFMTQKYRDDMKRRICKEKNITLIEVPYTIKVEDIKDFLIKVCKSHGYL
jgi:hypothetical protein